MHATNTCNVRFIRIIIKFFWDFQKYTRAGDQKQVILLEWPNNQSLHWVRIVNATEYRVHRQYHMYAYELVHRVGALESSC